MRVSIAKAFINSARVAIRAKANDLARLHLGEALDTLRKCEYSAERSHLISLCAIVKGNLKDTHRAFVVRRLAMADSIAPVTPEGW